VRARTTSGRYSVYHPIISRSAEGDTLAPLAPTNITIKAGVGSLEPQWTNDDASDLAGVAIKREITATEPADEYIRVAQTAPGEAGSFNDTGLKVGVEFFYWFASYDRTGNVSGFVGPHSATVLAVDLAEVEGKISGSQIEGDAITSSHLGLNIVGLDNLADPVTTEIANAAQSALADKTAAEAAADAAQTAESNTAAAQAIVEDARDAAIIAQTEAEGAAASSETFSQQASTARDTADGHAAAAAQSAGVSAQAASDAGDAAGAASDSATVAEAEASDAGAAASLSETHANTAGVAAGDALAFRNTALEARDDAEGFASTASSEAGVAASSASRADARASRNLIDKGEFETLGETGIWTGTVSNIGQVSHPNLKRALRVESANSFQGDEADKIVGDWGGRYLRFTGWARRVGATPALHAGVQSEDAAGVKTTITSGSHSM